jgi:hypothetical protein
MRNVIRRAELKPALGAAAFLILATASVAWADEADEQLARDAATINSQAPTMVDKTTRLDSAAYHNRVFVYHYTQLAHPSYDYSRAQKKKFAELMKAQVVGRACTGSSLRPYIDAGVSFKYVHFGSDNVLIAAVIVTRKDCTELSAAMTRRERARGPSQSQRSDATATRGDEAIPAKPEGPQLRAIRKGMRYEEVMSELRGLDAKKKTYGDYLKATYSSPELLAYPDAGGACQLTFDRGRVLSCEGCNPDRFRCSE